MIGLMKLSLPVRAGGLYTWSRFKGQSALGKGEHVLAHMSCENLRRENEFHGLKNLGES
ncbi:hypothetical protein, unlikely [Trypanosoma brucei brucei TREU927]|uniref:Uncharacterized protein n=1 Tax=Trypanosoma brucei brucei (strain 927/4 GUTat10.1) TaxID=185431 RepID=Q4GYK9_TRYB2|nr:hypothetical protein, unlikely [Trypanosoma brucei brucei TREU927]CAJ16575.1 hypothetical protein, unlikely [Trypanosoma brucei brucei TREU927]